MSKLASDDNSNAIQAFRLPNTNETFTSISVGPASVASTALPAGMYYFCSTVDCHVVQGTNGVTPTATTNHLFIPAYAERYFYINANQKVAAIAAFGAGTGTLFIARMP